MKEDLAIWVIILMAFGLVLVLVAALALIRM
jgi:multisubunit Na+/H+ antiporter MnhG subunit